MSLTLRTLATAAGKELENCDGTPAANIAVTFKLVDEGFGACSVVDSITGQHILSKTISVNTDANGALSVSLWPTSRADKTCYYEVIVPNGPSFIAPLTDGAGTLDWDTFMAGRIGLTV